MRIAFLSPVYPPMVSGASLVIQRLAEGMAARGHQVLVVTASDRPDPYVSDTACLRIVRLRSYRNPLRAGQRAVLWPQGALTRALEDFKPDLLHISDPLQLAVPGLLYARRKGIASVYTIQQLPWFVSSYLPDVSWLKRCLEDILWNYARWLIRQFHATVTPTRTIAGIVSARTGVTPSAISSGVDLEVFAPACSRESGDSALRARLGIPSDAPVILHVGRLDLDKQVDRVITACAPVIRETGAYLLVVGDGQQRERLTQLCEDLGIQSWCRFTGFVSVENGLADIYRLASVFVTASQIETQGIVLLEAAACGIPIVAVDATCIAEIVHQDVNGCLVPPGSPDDMARQISRLLRDPHLSRNMGTAGRRIVLEHATGRTLDKYENLFTNCHSDAAKWAEDFSALRNINSLY